MTKSPWPHPRRRAAIAIVLGLLAPAAAAAPDVRLHPLEIDAAPEDGVTAKAASWPASRVPDARRRERMLERVARQGTARVIVGLAGRGAGVRLDRDELAAGTRQLAARLGPGAAVGRRYRAVPFVALTVDGEALRRLLDLAAAGRVASVEADVAFDPLLASSTPVVGAPDAWSLGWLGEGQAVAVLDSGVDAMHAFFDAIDGSGSRIVAEACFSTTDPAEHASSLCSAGAPSVTGPGSGLDCPEEVYPCFHGTHVAGIAAGRDPAGSIDGVAPAAGVVAIQIFSRIDDAEACGSRPSPCVRVFASDLIAGLDHVLALGATLDVAAVNLSLGGGSYTDVAACDADFPATLAIATALREAGIAVVAASGNSGWVHRMVAPACLSPVVSVASVRDSGQVSSFSCVAPFLDFLAPGNPIDSAVPGGGVGRYSGSSMAAPHVAGAWALMREAHPDATVDDVLRALRNTGTLLDDDRTSGRETDLPRIDVGRAVRAPVTSPFFTVYNDGDAPLAVTAIAPETDAPWIAVEPAVLTVEPGGYGFVRVDVDFARAPLDGSRTRLLVVSDDADESPYPDGVFVDTPALPYCGNGIVDRAGEACDDGDGNSDTAPDACRTTCRPADCGDGVVDTGESCDDGTGNSDTLPDACRTTCEPAACGDGVVDAGEACDGGDGLDCRDDDGDGFVGCLDCDDADAGRWGPVEVNDGLDNQCPGEVGFGLVDETGPTAVFGNPDDRDELGWAAQPRATAYEVARAGSAAFASCRCVVTPEPRWRDPERPDPGAVFFYLNRAREPASGSWGASAAGLERPVACP